MNHSTFEIANILRTANKKAKVSSYAEVMAYIISNLDYKILGYTFKMDMTIVYCADLFISDLLNSNYGKHDDVHIHIGSDYILVNGLDVNDFIKTHI